MLATLTLIRAHRSAVVSLAVVASGGAWAQDASPWYIGATQSLTHDSNAYRVNDSVDLGPEHSRADTYSSTGVVGGLDQQVGRQRFFGSADVRYNKYQDNDNLTNTSYGVRAGWDWDTVWNLSGGLNLLADQNLAQLNGNAAAVAANVTDRNLVKNDRIGARILWGGSGLLTLRGDYAHSRVRYSLASRVTSNSSADVGSFGAYYNIDPDLTAGLGLRLSRTEQGDASVGAADDQTITSDGRNIDLSLNWRYSVLTGINARLSWSRQTKAGGGNRDFSGLTGSLSASYAPTPKLAFSLAYNRDSGTNGTFFNVPGQVDAGGETSSTTVLVQNSQVSDRLSLGGTYAATAKIGVTAGYSYRKSKVENAGGGDFGDKLQTASLGANWAIARAWQLGCRLSHEQRDTTNSSALGYSANVIGCTAQLTLR